MLFVPEVLRTLSVFRRRPGFVLSTSGLLAIGIAAATITFTFANALLIKPLPVPEPDRLFRVVTVRPRLGPRSYFSERFYRRLRSEAKAFSIISATYDVSTGYTDGNRTERVLASATSGSFFTLFGIAPIVGAEFASDTASTETPPALLSHSFWLRRYGGAHNVIGRPIAIRGVPFVIAGVLPAGFNGTTIESGPDLRVPLSAMRSLFPEGSDQPWSAFELVGRLAPNVTASAARAEAYRLYVNSSAKDDPPVPSNEFALQPVSRGVSRLRDQVGAATAFGFDAAALLALMICVNLSGLLLARVIARRRELAVLSALGASHLRLAAVMLTEAAMIVLSGALLAAVFTVTGVRWVVAQLPPVRLIDNTAVPMTLNMAPDWRILIFVTLLCFVAFVFMAVVPAWKAAHSDPYVLREGNSGTRTRGWKVLVAVQMCLCTALLFGAAAVKATLDNLRSRDPGMAVDQVICFSVDRDLTHPEQAERFTRTAAVWQQKVRSLPGVRSAAISSIRLMRGSGQKITVAPAGGSVPSSDFLNTSTIAIGPEYFETVGQKVLEGRLFMPDEYAADNASRKVRSVVVNQAFARRFGDGTPMPGRRFGFGAEQVVIPQVEVIGVVTDAKYRSMREPVQPTMYSPISSEASRITLLVRTYLRPQSLAEPVRDALRSVDPTLLPEDVSTLEQDIQASLWPERALLWLSNAFAAIAAVVAAAGLGGLMIFLVASRTREIAVRVAVGAAPRDIWTVVVSDSLLPVLSGLGVGCAAGVALIRTAQGVLYGVSLSDPYLPAVAAAGVTLVGLAGVVVPIFRALRVDPAQALREN